MNPAWSERGDGSALHKTRSMIHTQRSDTNEKGLHRCKPLELVRPKRFELLTPWFVAKYSIQLSYGRFEGCALYAVFA